MLPTSQYEFIHFVITHIFLCEKNIKACYTSNAVLKYNISGHQSFSSLRIMYYIVQWIYWCLFQLHSAIMGRIYYIRLQNLQRKLATISIYFPVRSTPNNVNMTLLAGQSEQTLREPRNVHAYVMLFVSFTFTISEEWAKHCYVSFVGCNRSSVH